MLSQGPTTTGVRQTAALGWARDAVEVRRWCCPRQLGQRIEFRQGSPKQAEKELTDAIGKGVDPLADGGARRPSAGQSLDHSLDAQTVEEVSSNHVLHQGRYVATIGMKRIGEQGVGTLAALTADPLYRDGRPFIRRIDPPLAPAPADQGVRSSTVGMGTAVRKGRGSSRDGYGFGIPLFRVAGCYDDHSEVPCRVPMYGDVGTSASTLLYGLVVLGRPPPAVLVESVDRAPGELRGANSGSDQPGPEYVCGTSAAPIPLS